MKLFVTDDLAGSCREAHEAFTHNILFETTHTVAPRLFDTEPIVDQVTALWAPWHGNLGQVAKWRAKGGLLVWRDRATPPPCDVLLVVEPPPARRLVERLARETQEYAVVQRPIWSSMEKTLDLATPDPEIVKMVWEHCRGRKVLLSEMSQELGMPGHYLSRLWKAAGAVKRLDVIPYLVPESEEGRLWWPHLVAYNRGETTQLTCPRKYLKMWTKEKRIATRRGAIFGNDPPDYELAATKRKKAIRELAELRTWLESRPVHPTK
jgi:hypothetical protein